MKISKIEQVDDTFIITRTPNLVQRLFGLKERQEKYKDTGDLYHHFDHIRVYINQNGEILGPLNQMTKRLENWRRKF